MSVEYFAGYRSRHCFPPQNSYASFAAVQLMDIFFSFYQIFFSEVLEEENQ